MYSRQFRELFQHKHDCGNMFERAKDEHGIEIAHNLRYAAGYIISYMVHACVGYDKAQEFMPDVWKAVVFERFDDYHKEHLNVVL